MCDVAAVQEQKDADVSEDDRRRCTCAPQIET